MQITEDERALKSSSLNAMLTNFHAALDGLQACGLSALESASLRDIYIHLGCVRDSLDRLFYQRQRGPALPDREPKGIRR